MVDSAREWVSHVFVSGATELSDPNGEAAGLLSQHGGHYSLEIDGLSPEQASRVLKVLSLGSAADHCLERATAEAASWG